MAAQVEPDLIITDIQMPHKDGIEVIAALNDAGSEIPIIAISGGRHFTGPAFELNVAELLRIKSTLAKPFTRADLRLAIEGALS